MVVNFSLLYRNLYGLSYSVDRDDPDLTAAFGFCRDLAGFADFCDLLVAADISQLGSVSRRHQFLAFLQLDHVRLDLICVSCLERNARLLHGYAPDVGIMICTA